MAPRPSPSLRRATLLLLPLVLLAGAISPASAGAAPEPRDREIDRMVREVSADRIKRSINTLASFGTRHTLSSQDDPERGIGAARDWIFDEFTAIAATSGGRMTVAKQSFVQPADGNRIPEDTVITNVVATLRGTQEESAGRTYVVSGHYDSRCSDVNDATCDAPGANDDASGVAVSIETARVMASRTFDGTIVFMAVAGEEQGLFGSEHFAEQAEQDGVDIQGMFTNDIVGSADGENGSEPRAVRVFSEGVPTSETDRQRAIREAVGGENDGESRQLARFIAETTRKYVPGFETLQINRRDRYLRGGDQIPFLERGYPAVRFTEVNETFEHQHQDVRVEDGVQFGDLTRFVEYDYTARVARSNLASLAVLARAPRAPGDTNILTARLTNDTDLRWAANPEPDLAGYEVVWRETTEPEWTHSRFVGNVTTHTVEGVSKDNFQFGVRAVDTQGHRSPVSFPVPASR